MVGLQIYSLLELLCRVASYLDGPESRDVDRNDPHRRINRNYGIL